jgi:hypothetical protein
VLRQGPVAFRIRARTVSSSPPSASPGSRWGPAGFAWLVATGQWPTSAVVSIRTNDLVWWGPSAPYCHDARPSFRTSLARPSMQT